MNSTMSACSTVTRSIGVPVLDCICTPPAVSAPNRRPARTVPPGLARPSSATVIALNPMPASMSPVIAGLVPRICAAPARPASAPARTITVMYARDTLMPAVRAAYWLAPTARSSKPTVLRPSSHQTKTAAARATNSPRLTRIDEPSSAG